MNVPPYRSIYSKKYHFRDDCGPAQKRIKPKNRVDGDGGLPPCSRCATIEEEEGR